MSPHPDFQRALELMQLQAVSLQRAFGHVFSGASLIANNVNYPNHPEETAQIRSDVLNLIQASLLVYLFAMWESHEPQAVLEWLTAEEVAELQAYRHLRDSAAHKFGGARADYPARRAAFEAKMPFDGVQWDRKSDTIDLACSHAAHGCLQVMQRLTKHLVVRLHAGKSP